MCGVSNARVNARVNEHTVLARAPRLLPSPFLVVHRCGPCTVLATMLCLSQLFRGGESKLNKTQLEPTSIASRYVEMTLKHALFIGSTVTKHAL